MKKSVFLITTLLCIFGLTSCESTDSNVEDTVVLESKGVIFFGEQVMEQEVVSVPILARDLEVMSGLKGEVMFDITALEFMSLERKGEGMNDFFLTHHVEDNKVSFALASGEEYKVEGMFMEMKFLVKQKRDTSLSFSNVKVFDGQSNGMVVKGEGLEIVY